MWVWGCFFNIGMPWAHLSEKAISTVTALVLGDLSDLVIAFRHAHTDLPQHTLCTHIQLLLLLLSLLCWCFLLPLRLSACYRSSLPRSYSLLLPLKKNCLELSRYLEDSNKDAFRFISLYFFLFYIIPSIS